MITIDMMRENINEKYTQAKKEGNKEKLTILEGFELMLSCFEFALEEEYASPIEVCEELTELNTSLEEVMSEI